MGIITYNPVDLIDRMDDSFDLIEDMDRWFNFPDLGFMDNLGLFEGEWSPALDMYEDDDAYFVKVDVPGIDPKDIDINVAGDVLTIKGERREGDEEDKKSKKKGRKYQREERFYGSFHRTVPLAVSVDIDHVDARTKDGVLYITLPKKEEVKPKKISVNVS